MRKFILLILVMFLTTLSYAELVLDFNYDLQDNVLSLNKDVTILDDKSYMFVVYKNGISVVREEEYELKSLNKEPMILNAKEGDLLSLELWGDNGLIFSEEITAGSNAVKETVKKEIISPKPQSVLIGDEVKPNASILIDAEDIGEEMVEKPVEIKQEMYGYEDKGNTSIGQEGFGYSVEQEKREERMYGHKTLGYESKDETYGHKTLGYESKDESYGRKDY